MGKRSPHRWHGLVGGLYTITALTQKSSATAIAA
jgi:hypothetical protein